MRAFVIALMSGSSLVSSAACAEETSASEAPEIVVTGARADSAADSKIGTPAIETPQPITIIDDALYLAQGAVSVGDTLNYVSGVTANPYGPDSRVDGAFVRGVDALQFRDGMRDIFSYYASIRADPFNFDQVELVRGPASVLFGQGAIGGIINLVSKRPEFIQSGELALRYGSFGRKEILLDFTGPVSDAVAGRIVARARDAGAQTEFVPDDRLLLAPSLSFKLSPDTEFTLIGLYQEDDGGSTSQFLPVVGTLLPNPNGQLANSLFIGKPGWDRYDGRLLQATALFSHDFGDTAHLNLKARYIDSDLTYLTHYPDNYSNPANPFLDPAQRVMGLYVDGSIARMEVFSTDNNVQLDFDTGTNVEHSVLAGVDYSFNRVRKSGGFGYEVFDIYDLDYAALSDYGGGLPAPASETEDVQQDQLGLYLQDQVRFFNRVSVVLGARRDWTSARSFAGPRRYDAATTLRAGIIGELARGVSPFFSYTESFEPIAGTASDGTAFVPKSGYQYEAGIKFHPSDRILVTFTGYRIRETNRPVSDDTTADPFDQIQIGSLTSKGLELEGTALLQGDLTIIANASYNDAKGDGTGRQLDNVPKINASLWLSKRLQLTHDASLKLGAGARYVGENRSYGPAFPAGIVTPSYTLFDALAEVSWDRWSFTVNATNLLGTQYYAACLARGDCFMGSARNVFGTVGYRF